MELVWVGGSRWRENIRSGRIPENQGVLGTKFTKITNLQIYKIYMLEYSPVYGGDKFCRVYAAMDSGTSANTLAARVFREHN